VNTLSRSLLILALIVGSALAHAQSPAAPPASRDSVRSLSLDTVKVTGRIDDLRGIATTASEGRVGFEDHTVRARPSNLVNSEIGYSLRSGTRIQLSLLNLLNRTTEDIQYAYTSRLRGETSDGVDDLHFHPAEPRQIRVSADVRF
jgi:hypothetical protein